MIISKIVKNWTVFGCKEQIENIIKPNTSKFIEFCTKKIEQFV